MEAAKKNEREVRHEMIRAETVTRTEASLEEAGTGADRPGKDNCEPQQCFSTERSIENGLSL